MKIECTSCKGNGIIEICTNGRDIEEYICAECKGLGGFDAEPETMGFVNVYSVTRHYGGPEEGGWYYNILECIETFPCRYKNRYEIMDYMETEHADKRYGDIYSVLGGKDITMKWEESPCESETKDRPYYE